MASDYPRDSLDAVLDALFAKFDGKVSNSKTKKVQTPKKSKKVRFFGCVDRAYLTYTIVRGLLQYSKTKSEISAELAEMFARIRLSGWNTKTSGRHWAMFR